MKELVLEIQSYRIFITQENHRISERSPTEVPIDCVAEARDSVADQWLIAVNICKERTVDKRYTVGHSVIHYSFHSEIFFSVGGGCKDGGWVQGEWEISQIGVHDEKFTKNQYKDFFLKRICIQVGDVAAVEASLVYILYSRIAKTKW